MTELLTGVEAPSDAELISSVRGGDLSAYGELFARHVEAARRLGRQLVRGPDVDDLVSDAFAKTLNVLQNGGGPDVAFRAYLLTSLRRLHVDKIRAAKKVQPEEDMTVFDDGVPFQDTAIASFDNGAAAKAFASLPERWQLVLWHLEVEGQKPADIAPLLGMTPNSVSALAYRAREGLRQAFLTMHLADTPTEQCRWVNEHLGAYVRKGLSKRDTTKVEDHLEDCRRCTAMYLELNEVNSNLAGIIAPLLLGAAAAGYISSAGGAGVTGVSALFGRFRDAVSGNGATGGAGAGGSTTAAGGGAAVTTGGLITAGGVVAASVAAITAAAFIFGGGAEKEVITEADQPIGVVQTPAPGAGEDREPREKSAPEDSEAVAGPEAADEPAGEDVPFAAAADGDGLDLDGTADPPDDFAAAPAVDTGVVAPPAVVPADPAPGTDPPAGDTPNAPGDDTPPASDDGDPVTEDPGTNPPGTDEPDAEEPGAEDPQDPVDETPTGDPTSPPAEEEPPPTPTGPPPLATSIEVTDHDVVDGSLSLTVDGADTVASVRVRVASAPADVTIAASAGCVPETDDWWLCSPTAGANVQTFVARVLGTYQTAATEQYVVSVPLSTPRELTRLSELTLDYILPTETDREPRSYTLLDVPVANVGLTGGSVLPPAFGDEYLTATAELDGISDVDTSAVYTLTGDATWDTAITALGCSFGTTAAEINCPVLGDGPARFHLLPDDPRETGSASIRVSPLPGHLDGTIDDNTISLTLPPIPVEPADGETETFGFDGAVTVVETLPGQIKRVFVPLKGVASDDEVELTLVGDPMAYFCEDCEQQSDGSATATRTVQTDAGRTYVEFWAMIPGGSPVQLTAAIGEELPVGPVAIGTD